MPAESAAAQRADSSMRKWRHGYSSRPRVKVALSAEGKVSAEQLSARRRLLRSGLYGLGISCCVLLLATQWWQRQPIREIRWSGLQKLSAEELRSLLSEAVTEKTPLVFEHWRQALLRHPLVERATLYWEAPGIVHIAIEERHLLALLAESASESLLCLDADGTLRELPQGLVRERLPRIELPQPRGERLAECLRVLQSVPRDSVTLLRWEPSSGWTLYLRSGSVLRLGDTTGVEAKWQRWSRLRERRNLPAWVVADLRWRELVVLQPPVPQRTPVP